MNKPRRTAPAKRPAREIEARRNRALRREQIEQAERARRRALVFLEPNDEARYKP